MKHEMACPRCGAAMNFEAEKLREPTTREEADSSRTLGGTVIAVFACPNCGWIAERREDDADA
jgi:predicted RNA-binding Zn-ribbon protein involved in translation (DUF1610 family)